MILPRRQFGFVILCLLVTVSQPVGTVAQSDEPTIDIVAPNPVTSNDAGEYVVIDPGEPMNFTGWTLSDGTHHVALPDVGVDGSVAISAAPSVTALLTDLPVLEWDGYLPLAADGERLDLRNPAGNVVDSVEYGSTAANDHWMRIDEDLRVQAGEIQPFSFDSHDSGAVTTFVLPDSPETPHDVLAEATDRLWIAGYELTDPTIATLIRERYAAGVDVRVLLDGSPVNGQSEPEVAALDELDEAGVPVRVLEGVRDRFRYHHPKYALVDDQALVMTENWKPAGTGGASSRGWGIVFAETPAVADLATVFETDYVARDTVSWTRQRRTVEPRPETVSEGGYPATFSPETTAIDALKIVVTPTGAEREVSEAIRSADERIDVQQVQIGDVNFPLLQELIAAADRGVRVRILLDNEWYVSDENRAFAETLAQISDREELPLDVRLVDPAGRFGKIHAKGIIIDERTTVVGSMNWNNVSMRENREVMAIVDSRDVAAFFTETFEHDWSAPGSVVPAGTVIATVVTWIVVGVFARRVLTFEVG